jgi:hypothetical protein
MKLSDFPYTTTTGLAEYSKMITEIIDLFRTKSVIGTIHPDPASSPTDEDRLVYWDTGPDNICFGQPLLFKTIHNEEFNFWTGLHSTSGEANLIVFFEKTLNLHNMSRNSGMSSSLQANIRNIRAGRRSGFR